MSFQKAKDILFNSFTAQSNTSSKHAKHEFQAYAYRLAYDLNDLVNLKMYLRLAKTIERPLLEEAYAYAIDSALENKSRIFLWKLKQVRSEFKKKLTTNNFNLDHVLSQLRKFRNTFVNEIFHKILQDSNFDTVLSCLQENHLVSKKNFAEYALVINLSSNKIYDFFCDYQYKTHIIEISDKLSKIYKDKMSLKNNSKFKIFVTNIFKKVFSTKYSLIYSDCFLNFIPMDFESKFLFILSKIVDPEGVIVLGFKSSDVNVQEWREVNINNTNALFFYKTITPKHFESITESLGFNIIHKISVKDTYFYFLSFSNF